MLETILPKYINILYKSCQSIFLMQLTRVQRVIAQPTRVQPMIAQLIVVCICATTCVLYATY